MNFSALLRTPFPKPQLSKRNLFWLSLIGLSCSLFIILYKPFGIQNVHGQWYYDLVVLSMGVIFIVSILLLEWSGPNLFPKSFQSWTFGKAIIWYSSMTLFVGAMIFLYKSWWGGFRDFTLIEYFLVMGRVILIVITVSFFVVGIFHLFNRKKISLLTNKENYSITSPNGKSIHLHLKEILYIESDDNYVNIHLESRGVRRRVLFRSSLKNVETQIVHPFSPIYRCHRGYLINIDYFNIQKVTSRSMKISLKNYSDEVPVSKQYIDNIKQLLLIHH